MSIPVDLDELAAVLARFGSGYLLTTTDGRVKVVAVDPSADGLGLRVAAPGVGTLRNLAGNSALTLVFPPTEAPGNTLLIDGTGTVDGDDVVVLPSSAVLHRPATS